MENFAFVPPPAATAPRPGPSPGPDLGSDHLLDTLPWGVIVLNAQGTVLRLNQQAATWWGLPQAAAQGQPLALVGPAALPLPVYEALQQAAAGASPAPDTFFLPQAGQCLTMTSRRHAADTVVYWQDSPLPASQSPALASPAAEALGGAGEQRAHAQTQAVLYQSEARYRTLFATMEQGFCLLEKTVTAPGELSDYRYLAVNPAFARHTGLADVTGKTLRQMVPGVESHIVALYDSVVATGEPRRMQEYVAPLDMWIEAEILPDPQPGYLAVLFSNVSVRYRAEQALRESEARQAYLLALSDALQPVDEASAVQATVTHTARHYFGADRCYYGELAGDTVTIRRDAARPGLPSVAGVYSLRAMPMFKAMLRGSAPVVVADVHASPVMDDHLKQLCLASSIRAYINVPITRNAKLVGIMCLTQETPREWTATEVALMQETADRTWAAVERTHAEEALRQSEAQFRSLVMASSGSVYKMSPDWHQMHQLLGKNFLTDTPQASSTWLEQYIPVADQPLVQAAIEVAIRTKTMFELEHHVRQADGRVGWVYSRAIPVLDAQGTITEWLGAAQDITARKQAEAQLRTFTARLEQQVAERTQALQDSRDLLHAVAESQTVVLSAFTAVRDAQHQLIDVACIFVNARAASLAEGQPVVGQRYLAQVPADERADLLASYDRIIDTGVTEDREFARPAGQSVAWFRTISTKLGDGVLVSSEDITRRKHTEQERTTYLRRLEQAEAVAALGSWEYDLATQALTWSSGMYRLFGLPPGSPCGPHLYLDFAVAEDQPAAERLVRSLRAGASDFEEMLHVRVGEVVKTLCVKGVLLADEQGQPVRLLGVDLDISAVQRLEAENHSLKVDQQKKLLLSILQAQETERKRLAETLHNGLGQVLYATKLHFNQLDTPALRALPALNEIRAHADRLLAEAISQTRTLAHELVPASLEKIGLARALQDICRDLSTPHVRLTCHVWLDEQELPQSLQVALYRLAQELAHNILKHAQASQAMLELETLPGWVMLRAEDNGHGFDPTATSQGLGLRMLQEAVELLGGTVTLDSSPEYGTHIRLRIPIPPLSSL